jgi:hypothetical protein
MRQVWLRSLHSVVREDDERLSFRPLPWGLFIVLGFVTLIGLLMVSVGKWGVNHEWIASTFIDPLRMRESFSLFLFAGWLTSGFGAGLFFLTLVPVLVRVHTSLVVLDFARGRVFRRGRWRDEDPRAIAVRVEDVARPECTRLVARGPEGDFYLVTGHRLVFREKLVAVAARITELSGAKKAAEVNAGIDPRFEAVFIPAFLLLLGVAWTVLGLAQFRDAVWRMHGIAAPAWMIGVPIFLLGVLEAGGVPVVSRALAERRGKS